MARAKPKTFDEDPNYYLNMARTQPGIRGVAARFGDNIAAGYGREFAQTALSEWDLEMKMEPVPMPLPADATAQTARKKSVATQRKRRGRRSTILTPLNIEDEGVLGA